MINPHPQRGTLWQLCLKGLALASLLLWGAVTLDVARQVGHPMPGFRCEEGLSVSPQTDPGWSGPRHGLKSYDYLLRADDKPLRHVCDLEGLVAATPAGRAIDYEVWREGQVVHVSVPTQTLTIEDALGGFGPALLSGLLHLLIGITAFWMRPAHPAAQAHLILTAAVGLGFQTLGVDFTLTHRFGLLYAMAVFLPGAAMLHLALVFPEPGRRLRAHPWLAVLVYVPYMLLAAHAVWVFDPKGLLARGLPSGPAVVEWPFIAWGVGSLLGALALLGRALATAFFAKDPDTRMQGRIVLVGSALAFAPCTTLYLLPALFGSAAGLSMGLVNFAQVALVCFPLSIALAVLRYRLFAIDVLIRRSAAGGLALASMTALYALVFLTAHLAVGDRPLYSTSIAGLVVGLAFAPAYAWTRKTLDRVFFRAPYDFQALVTAFGEEARRELDPSSLLEAFARTLGSALHPASLLLLRAEDGTLALGHAEGAATHAPGPGFVPAVLDAVERAEPFTPIDAHIDGRPMLLVLLTARDDRLGVLALGPRKGELPYYPPDRALVVHVCQTLAASWQNARLFERVMRRNEALAQANAELKQLDTLKRQFLNAVSHELRTPLTSIVGFGEFLTEELGGPLTPLQAEFVGHIRASARHLNGLVDDMLDYAQVEAGTFRLDAHWGTLEDTAREAFETMRPQAVEKGVTLVFEEPASPVEGPFDPVRLAQVVLNLIGNAIKFTPEGGAVTMRLGIEDGEAVLEVEDTGIGVREDLHDKLFDKFFQVDPSSTRRAGGTGLGLAITRAIVEAHQGAIALESSPGRGSRFTVRLPGFETPSEASEAGVGGAGVAKPAPQGFHGEDGASEDTP